MPLTQTVNTTSIYQLNGKDVKIHTISTGLISVKNNFLSRKRKGVFSKISILPEQQRAAFMPIWVWVIEHPEGIIVIDIGDVEEANHKDFYKQENLGSRFLLWIMEIERKITKQDE